jgi:hypothetical protein
VRIQVIAGATAGDVWKDLVAPDDLVDRQRGNLLELQVDHRLRLGGVGLGQLDDAEEHLFRRQPRDVQAGLQQGIPVLADHLFRERLTGKLGLGLEQVEFVAAGVELPELPDLGAGQKYVAIVPASHGSGRSGGPE